MTLRRRARFLAVIVVVLLAGATVGWAARTVTVPTTPSAPEAEFALVAVAEQDVGSSIALRVVASWESVQVGVNEASGIVTELTLKPGDLVTAGTVLFRVDDRPVSAAKGAMPAYRDLSQGARGQDVNQLQEFLVDQGRLSGEPDGVYGGLTTAAVRAWQKDHGIQVTGTVPLGDIMFLPELDVRGRLTADLIRGSHVSGGELLVEAYGATPEFVAPLNQNQVELVTAGMVVELETTTGKWAASVVDVLDDAEGAKAVLTGSGGQPVCQDSCGEVPVAGLTSYQASAILAPAVYGPAIPTAALLTRADGGFAVTLADGSLIDVDVEANGNGYAVLTGIDVGTQVRVPGQ